MYLKHVFPSTFLPSHCVTDLISALRVWTRLFVHRFWMKRSALWHPCSSEGNSYLLWWFCWGCIHCNCIPSNALIGTFCITCNFMDILIAMDYLCLGLLQYRCFFQCSSFILVALFLLRLSQRGTELSLITAWKAAFTCIFLLLSSHELWSQDWMKTSAVVSCLQKPPFKMEDNASYIVPVVGPAAGKKHQ